MSWQGLGERSQSALRLLRIFNTPELGLRSWRIRDINFIKSKSTACTRNDGFIAPYDGCSQLCMSLWKVRHLYKPLHSCTVIDLKDRIRCKRSSSTNRLLRS